MFTAAPPLAIGIFDIVCTAETRLKFPKLYSQTLDTFNVRIFWIWVLNALFHSFLIFWICMSALDHEVLWFNGQEGGYLFMGNCIYTVSKMAVFSKFSINQHLFVIISVYYRCRLPESWSTLTIMVLYRTHSHMVVNNFMVCVCGHL